MEKKIRFSIIMPTYGVQDYIAEALGCLMNQTYDDFEVIVVDDASPDRSGEIAKRFATQDDRFIYVRHEENQGVSAARNTGIARATGDYLLFLDPDDTYEVHLLKVLAQSLQYNPVDVLVYGFTEDYRDEAGKIQYSRRICLQDIDDDDASISTNDSQLIHKMVMQLEKTTMLGYPWNKAFKASLIRENDISFIKIKHIEDILFNADVFEYARSVTILADVLYHYRNQGQVRLTGGNIENYFELQKQRVKRLYDQQQNWRTCDFEALEILASEYFRSFQSMMVRNLEKGMAENEIIKLCQEETQSELYQELKRFLPANSKSVKLLYEPLAQGDFKVAMHRAKVMKFTRERFPKVWNKAKQIR